jgi:hypothetical protein
MINSILKVLLLLVFSIFYRSNTCYAIHNTVKFHLPETEAERALDRIMMIESGLVKGDNNDIYTKSFNVDYHKWIDKIHDNKECETNDLCLGESSVLTCVQDSLTDIGFLYYTVKIENDIIYIRVTKRI